MAKPTARPMAIKITLDIKERVKRLAEARDRTPHWMVCEAVGQYVDREEKREAVRQDALNAWNHYRATGLHLTAAEADFWLAKLEAGAEAEPPLCHT